MATLRLPISNHRGLWTANITFTTFGKAGTEVTVNVADDLGSPSATWSVPASHTIRKELLLESQGTDAVLQFSFGDVLSPFQLGISADRRRLGIGLISLDLHRIS